MLRYRFLIICRPAGYTSILYQYCTSTSTQILLVLVLYRYCTQLVGSYRLSAYCTRTVCRQGVPYRKD